MSKILIFISLLCSTLLLKATTPVQKDGVSGNFDLGINFTKNTESTFQFNNVFLVNYTKGRSNFSLGNNMAFISKTGEENLLNKGTQDFKYALNYNKFNTNITVQHLYDISRSIKNRYASGIGLSYNLTDKDDKKLGMGLSALREKEIPLEGEYKLQNRLSAHVDFMLKLTEHISLTTSNQYQPSIKEAGDFRWTTNISLRINLNAQFLLIVNSTFNYDSFPEAEIPETDYQLINSISYTF